VKIAISTSVIQRGRTGIAQYVFALIRSLLPHTAHHEIHLLVLEEDQSLFDFARDQVRILPVPEAYRPAVRNILWHQRQLPAMARQHGWDVLHVPSYRRLLWSRPCPLAATIHDLAPFRVSGKYDPLRMFYGRVIVRRLAHRQDAVIAISENTAADIRSFFGIPEARLHVIHNGLDHQRFHPGDPTAARAAVRQRFGLDQPFFLYVSRLEHPAKNHVRLIAAYDAFRKATGLPWLLAFGGSDWHGAEAIRAAAAAATFARDIRFLGFVADAELPDLYRAAGAFVYPSLYEGFGFPPVEAMACGCPVISSTRGALAEVVADAAECIDPLDVPDLDTALRTLATDETRRRQLVTAGLANAKRFHWDICAQNTLRVWASIAAATRATSPLPGPRHPGPVSIPPVHE
jgi:glycosyltransferase involved in cell wall biosynthesis